jgi:hypothetical protein
MICLPEGNTMSVIFQLFRADDLKLLDESRLNELKETIRQAVKDTGDSLLNASLSISRLIQDRHMRSLLPRTLPPEAATFNVNISQTQAVEVPPGAIDQLRKRVGEVFQQLMGKPPRPLTHTPSSSPQTPRALLDQLLNSDDFDELATIPTGRDILAWALTCELANLKTYEAFRSVQQIAEAKFTELAGQRPKGPDTPYSPFYQE